MHRSVLIAAAIAVLPLCAFADSASRQAGRAVGQFGAGVGEAVTEGMLDSLNAMQPQWITVVPRSKQDCLKESGGVVNSLFMRCRNGYQEYVRFDRNGNKIVLGERAIPMQ